MYIIIVRFCTQQTKGAIPGNVPGCELYVLQISTYKLYGSITCNFVLINLYFTSQIITQATPLITHNHNEGMMWQAVKGKR